MQNEAGNRVKDGTNMGGVVFQTAPIPITKDYLKSWTAICTLIHTPLLRMWDQCASQAGQQQLVWWDTVGGHLPRFRCPSVGSHRGKAIAEQTSERKKEIRSFYHRLCFHPGTMLFGLTVSLAAPLCGKYEQEGGKLPPHLSPSQLQFSKLRRGHPAMNTIKVAVRSAV